MSAREALIALRDSGVPLTPENIVTAAADPASPLHTHFEWDDTEAARRYRLVQAGVLVRRCRVTVEVSAEETRQVRAFLSVPTEDGCEYLPTTEALSAEHRDVVLKQALRDIAALRRKYAALLDVDAVIRSVVNAEESAA